MGILKKLFFPSSLAKQDEPKVKKESVLERLERERNLLSQNWKPRYDKEAALKRIFPRQGVGGVGVRIHQPNDGLLPTGTDGGTVDVTDAAEGQASAARAQERKDRDAFYNPLAMYGMDEKVLMYYESRVWIGYPAMAHLGTHEIISLAVDIPAKDAIARGFRIDIVTDDDDDDSRQSDENVVRENAKKVRNITKLMNKQYKICDVLRNFESDKRKYGVAYCIPVFKDGDDFDYSKPFNIDGIKKGSFVGMKVIEPIWLSYEFKDDGANSPASLNFYEPEWYRVANGNRIHKSWIVKKVYVPVSDLLKPTYYFGGISLTQMIYERIYCADKVANECPMLVMTKRLLVADANVQAMTADKKVAELTMEALNYFRDNFSVFFKNPNTQVSQIDTSLEGLPQVSMMQYQLAAAIAGMPVTKLLKNVPTGLQSTGDYEMDDYHELLGEIQKDYESVLDFFFSIMTKSEYGKELDIKVTFNSLEVPKKDKQIQFESSLSSVVNTYLSAKVLTVPEVRKIIREQENGIFSGISAKMPEELQKAIDAEQRQIEQMMNPPSPDGSMPTDGGDETVEEQPNDAGLSAEEQERAAEEALELAHQAAAGEGGGDADGQGDDNQQTVGSEGDEE